MNEPREGSTSRALLARARANDAQAWERLVQLYSPLLVQWCRARHVPREDVDDVVQEVFRAAFAGIGAFRKTQARDTFRGWLHTITLNKVNDLFRRCDGVALGGSSARASLAALPAAAPASDRPTGVPGVPAQQLRLQQALERIRDRFEARTWRAFWGTAVDGRAAADVAEELAMTAGAVRVAKARVLQRLRTELESSS